MAEATWLIANPAARGGAVARSVDAVAARVRAALGAVHVARTAAPGDATRLARLAVAEGARRVLSLGGDGTHGEVVDGLMRAGAHEVALGVLPAGTGGDFRRSLRHATLEAVLAALPTIAPRAVDVGLVSWTGADGSPVTRHFLNIASCGVSGLVDRHVNASGKRLGPASFAIAAVRALASFRAPTVRVTIDGEAMAERTVALVAACNGRYAGGGMCFAPGAALDDGLLDVVIIDDASLLRSLADLPRLFGDDIARSARVTIRRAREVRVEPTRGSAAIDVDGESPGDAPVAFRVLPGALRLLDGA